MGLMPQGWGVLYGDLGLLCIGYKPARFLDKLVRKSILLGVFGLPRTQLVLLFNDRLIDSVETADPWMGEGQSWKLSGIIEDGDGKPLAIQAHVSRSALGARLEAVLTVNGEPLALRPVGELMAEWQRMLKGS